MSEMGEAASTELAPSFSSKAAQKHLASFGGRDPPLALDAGNVSGDAIPKTTTMSAKQKVLKKVISKRV